MNACFLLGSSEIPRFEYALDPDEDEKPKCLKPTILPDIVNKAKENVRNVVANQKKGTLKLIDVLNNSFDKFKLLQLDQRMNFQQIIFLGPVEYVKAYDPFIYLIDGRAEVEIEQYITEAHTFDEFSVKVKFFDDLGKVENYLLCS